MIYLTLIGKASNFAPSFAKKEISFSSIEFVDVRENSLGLHLANGEFAAVNTVWYNVCLVADSDCPRIEPDCAERGEE